jgi:Autographiviridae exonuclease
MIALIDGDVVVYQAAWAHQQRTEWDDDVITVHANASLVKATADDIIADTVKAVGADRAVVALSDGFIFRQNLYQPYKQNRKKQRPVGYKTARTHLMEEYVCFLRPELEADDVLGILATGRIKGMEEPRVVCSIDKDLLTIPGDHYNWNKSECVEVSEEDADKLFFNQALSGDSSDGYPGCPGMGEKRSGRLIAQAWGDGPAAVWTAIVEKYEKAGFNEDFALIMARCARILRACDYDFKQKRPILWMPPVEEACASE